MEPQPPVLGNRRMGRPRAPPSSPAPPRSSNLGAQAAQRGDGGSAAGQAEAAPRSALLHQGLGERKKGAVCLSLQLTRLRTETGQGLAGRRRLRRKSPLSGDWGAGGGPGRGLHTERGAKRGGRRWQLREGAAVCRPRQRIGAPLFLPPCTLARNLTLSVLREPPFSASSQRPPATCLPPAHTHHASYPCQTRGCQECSPRQSLPGQPGNLPALGSQGRGKKAV